MHSQSTQFLSGVQMAFILMVLPISASAETINFVVTTTEDVLDYVCPTGGLPDDHCSLRDAVWAANFNPDPDTIELPAGHFQLTIAGDDDTGVAGDLDITDSVIIAGQGPGLTIIDATDLNDRVFNVIALGKNVGLANLTITGGFVNSVSFPRDGGGISHKHGSLVLSNVTVAGNIGAVGGGIELSGADLTVQDGSVISGNSAHTGGGIYVYGGNFTVQNSTITANETVADGGGIWADAATGNIYGSTISYNSVTNPNVNGGGGLYVGRSPWPDEINVLNSTIAGNRTAGKAAAVYVSETGLVNMASVTIDKNQADQNIVLVNDGFMGIINTIIVGYCDPFAIGHISTYGGNIESPLNTCSFDSGTNDQAGVGDPMLGPLGNFGGPTETILPLIGSPVVGNLIGTCPKYDQRGFLRTDGDCDTGAVERRPTDPILPFFSDGFETGDTTKWSSTVP